MLETSPIGHSNPAERGAAISGPLIFIATNRLKEGRFAAERERVAGLVELIEESETRLLAFNEYANEEGTHVGPWLLLAEQAASRDGARTRPLVLQPDSGLLLE